MKIMLLFFWFRLSLNFAHQCAHQPHNRHNRLPSSWVNLNCKTHCLRSIIYCVKLIDAKSDSDFCLWLVLYLSLSLFLTLLLPVENTSPPDPLQRFTANRSGNQNRQWQRRGPLWLTCNVFRFCFDFSIRWRIMRRLCWFFGASQEDMWCYVRLKIDDSNSGELI